MTELHSSPPPGTPEKKSLLPLLGEAVDRLNSLLKPEPALDEEEVICLGDMCTYDSQAEGEDWEGWSRWCGIFNEKEWEVLGYIRDAQRYYEVGEGSVRFTPPFHVFSLELIEQKYGRTLGVGFDLVLSFKKC